MITGTGAPTDMLKKGSGDVITFTKGRNGLGLNYIIALMGIFPPNGGGGGGYPDVILGEIRLFAGNYAPSGFAFCNGQLLPINQNQALYSLLGNTYGGNGITNFALPDLRGSVPVGFGQSGAGPSWFQGERSN